MGSSPIQNLMMQKVLTGYVAASETDPERRNLAAQTARALERDNRISLGWVEPKGGWSDLPFQELAQSPTAKNTATPQNIAISQNNAIQAQDADAKQKMDEANLAAKQSLIAQQNYQQGIDTVNATASKNLNPTVGITKMPASPSLPPPLRTNPLQLNDATASTANKFVLPNTSGITFGGS